MAKSKKEIQLCNKISGHSSESVFFFFYWLYFKAEQKFSTERCFGVIYLIDENSPSFVNSFPYNSSVILFLKSF